MAPNGRERFTNHAEPITLILKEKVLSLTGDAFEIRIDPQNGQEPYPALKVDRMFFYIYFLPPITAPFSIRRPLEKE